MKKYHFIFLIAATISGCATNLKTNSPEVLAGLKRDKVALVVLAPEKNVIYQEVLYRVLWLQYKDSKLSYDGEWNIENDMAPIYVKGLKSLGINAETFSCKICTPYQAELFSAYSNSPRIGNDKLTQSIAGPTDEFYKKSSGFNSFSQVSSELKDAGYSYLIQVYIPSLQGNAIGYGMVVVGSSIVTNIIDLKTNTVVWTGHTSSGEVYQLGGNLTALEKNNLKLLREGVITGTEKAFARGTFKTTLGFPPKP